MKGTKKPTTLKEKRFVREYIQNGGNQTQAALKVYNPKDYQTAKIMGVQVAKRLSIQELMEKRECLTDDGLLNTLAEGLSATKRVTSPTEPDSVDPDYQVRHRYLETGLKLKGHLREQNNTQINVFNQLNIDNDTFNLT